MSLTAYQMSARAVREHEATRVHPELKLSQELLRMVQGDSAAAKALP